MPQVTVVGQWKLVTKRTIGDKGYTFSANNPSLNFAAGSGSEVATTITPASITLVVNVTERNSQRIYFDLDDAATDEKGAWCGHASITPVENEELEAAIGNWQPGVESALTFALDFRLMSASLAAQSVYGTLPKLTLDAPAP